MKFKFCGGLDAPDWLLAEIAVLSDLSSVRMKLLCNMVVKTLSGVFQELDYDKIRKWTEDTRFSVSDVKAILTAIEFMYLNAVRFEVDPEALAVEVQQLGLPREHSTALVKPLRSSETRTLLRQKSLEKVIRAGRNDISAWRTLVPVASSMLSGASTGDACVQLQLKDDSKIAVSSSMYCSLYEDLRKAMKECELLVKPQ